MKRALFVICILASAILFMPSAEADLITYDAILTGPDESPPNASPGTGIALVDIDTVADTMQVQSTFSDLLENTTAAHIHAATAVAGAGTAGIATTVPFFPGFPIGVTSGTYDHLFDLTVLSTYNPAFVTANGGTAASAEAALLAALADGKAYFNIHTTMFPGGEIRGFLAPTAVPEPSTLLLVGSGLIGLAVYGRRRFKK